MGSSAWPEMEISPGEGRVLLQAARLRRFGVNYLQDAVCPGLGLLAHQDGSHVRLLAFSPRSNRGELSGVTNGGVVVDIDLEGEQICHSSNDNGRKDRTGKGETGYGELVATSEGAARGLSWARCSSCFADGAVDAASAASGGLMIGVGPDRQLNRESGRDAQDQEQHAAVGVGDADKGSSDGDGGGCGGDGLRPRSRPSSASGEWGGERICHLAVACGSEVRLWKVSRVFYGAGMAGTARGVRDGNDGYRYSIVKVLPDWHRTTCDNDNDNDSGSKNAPSPVGNIRCLSFRPCSDGMSGSPVAAARGGAVPLTAWYDMGAAVLRPGGSRTMFPSPVARKRACGAWSGCGRRLVVSSGGEIRVYSDPSEECAPSVLATIAGGGDDGSTIGVPGQLPAKVKTAWVVDPTVSSSTKESIAPLKVEEGGGRLTADREATLADCVGAKDPESSTFRTVLCAEAAMYEGGILSSPGSSPGGTQSSSPSSRPMTAPLRPRGGIGDIPPVFSAPRRKNQSELLFGGETIQHSHAPGTTPSSSAAAEAAAVPTKVRLSSPVLVGDMRAMCPAGPLAFFGTTDGGLGLDTAPAFAGTDCASEPFSTGSNGAWTKGGGDDLLVSITNSGNTARTAASDAAGGDEVDKSARRSGFRHVLPGDNWLSGSLRSSSSKRLRDSPPRQQGKSPPESLVLPVESVPVVPMAGRSTPSSGTSVVEAAVGTSRSISISTLPQSTAAPEVLDLRGKLGDGGSGGTGAVSAASTHPLFRLSLPGGVDPIYSSTIGLNSVPRNEGSNHLVSANLFRAGRVDATPIRRSCLVRVSCKSSSSSSSSRGKNNAAVRGSSGTDGVGVRPLASLPPELSLPDLLASSEDGRVVAVGSHACDLVACFRLEIHSSDAFSTVANDNLDTKGSGDHAAESCTLGSTDGDPPIGGREEASVDRSGARRRKRRQRRAVPLCTLRLPPGYRAKGLAFVREKQSRDDLRDGKAGTNAMPGSNSSAAEITPSDSRVGEEVLVLAGYALPDADVATDTAVPRPSKGSASPPGEPHRRGSKSTSEDMPYRTVLLSFLLPSGLSIDDSHDTASPAPASASPKAAGIDDAVRGGRGVGGGTVAARSSLRDRSRNAEDNIGSSGRKNAPGDSRQTQPPSTVSAGGVDAASRGSHSPSTRVRARGSPSSSVAEGDDGVDGVVTRLEAVMLEALAGMERRMNDRLNRVCDRLAALEDAVNSQ
ncbi:unnamed protein product [Pylaiella littoralis]